MLIFIGYVHFKRTKARRADMDVSYETNPYVARTLVNTQILVSLNLKLIDVILKQSIEQKLSEQEIDDVKELQKDLSKFISERTFANKMDLEFFKKIEETADT